MPADNDAVMLEQMGHALIDLQLKYRASPLAERVALRPKLEQLTTEYTRFQLRLIADGVVTTGDDLAEMESIRAEIDAAASKQKLIAALARTAAFVTMRV